MDRQQPPAPRKKPRQERSRQTVRAIREACGKVLRREGHEALTTERIAEVAGVNIASLYQYYPNKEAVIADFIDHEADGLAQRAADSFSLINRLSQTSLELTMAAIVDLEMAQQQTLVRLHPVFFHRYPEGANVHARVDALTRSQDNPDWASWLPDFLAGHRAQLRDTDPRMLAGMCQGVLHGVVTATSAAPVDAQGFAEARAELLFLLLTYLLKDPPSIADCRAFLDELPRRSADL